MNSLCAFIESFCGRRARYKYADNDAVTRCVGDGRRREVGERDQENDDRERWPSSLKCIVK